MIYQSVDAACKACGYTIPSDSGVKIMLESEVFQTWPSAEGIIWEVVSGSSLGLPEFFTLEELFAQAANKGYEPCQPHDVFYVSGYEVLLSGGAWVHVAMNPIHISGEDSGAFDIQRAEDEVSLDANLIRNDSLWTNKGRWLFRIKKDQ